MMGPPPMMGPGGMNDDGTPGMGGNPPTLGPMGPPTDDMPPPTGGSPGPMDGTMMPPMPPPMPPMGGNDGTPGMHGNPPTLGPAFLAKTQIRGECPPGMPCDENGDPAGPPTAEACAWFMGKCKGSKGDNQGMRHCLHACSKGPGSCFAFRAETQFAITGKPGTGIVDGACKNVMAQWAAHKAQHGDGGIHDPNFVKMPM